jgi:hypothetical protein
MRRIDKLNGLKSWWNRLAKPKYRTPLTADELTAECISEYENTGTVEMRAFYAKDGCSHYFYK